MISSVARLANFTGRSACLMCSASLSAFKPPTGKIAMTLHHMTRLPHYCERYASFAIVFPAKL